MSVPNGIFHGCQLVCAFFCGWDVLNVIEVNDVCLVAFTQVRLPSRYTMPGNNILKDGSGLLANAGGVDIHE